MNFTSKTTVSFAIQAAYYQTACFC